MKKNRHRVLPALAVAGLMALVMGCASGAPATPTPTATPTSAPTRGAPAIAFDKLWVELGTVARDQQGIQTFLVMNRGDSPLQVEQVSIQVEQGCDAAEAVEGSAEIQPGEAALLPIKLGQHRELGAHRLLVNVTSNDPIRRVATASLRFVVAEAEAPPVAGPRLQVDKEVIDIGSVPYDWPLYEQFTLRNDGDQPLVLEGTPEIRVEEGCWPPQVVVGSTTLEPGEETVLALPLFMGMHQGMGGPHVLAVDVRSNDPSEPVKTLRWRFTVEETEY